MKEPLCHFLPSSSKPGLVHATHKQQADPWHGGDRMTLPLTLRRLSWRRGLTDRGITDPRLQINLALLWLCGAPLHVEPLYLGACSAVLISAGGVPWDLVTVPTRASSQMAWRGTCVIFMKCLGLGRRAGRVSSEVKWCDWEKHLIIVLVFFGFCQRQSPWEQTMRWDTGISVTGAHVSHSQRTKW